MNLQNADSDAVLITGDISNAPGLENALGILAKNIHKTIYFVLGNHDRYDGSFRSVDLTVAKAKELYPNLIRLTGTEIIPLTEKTAPKWAWTKQQVQGERRRVIEDLWRLASQVNRFLFMFEKVKSYAETLRPTLISALGQFDKVIAATHVPPFVEATWHAGKISGPDYLPFFSSHIMGVMLKETAAKFQEKKIRVYRGHCHSEGFFRTANIQVFKGDAEYGFPVVQSIIEVECFGNERI